MVGTLWPVVDRSTAAFMERLYNILAEVPGSSRAEVLALVPLLMKSGARLPATLFTVRNQGVFPASKSR